MQRHCHRLLDQVHLSTMTADATKMDQLPNEATSQNKKSKVKWCIYIVPFPCNMLKSALQWSVYPQQTRSIYRCLWQPLQIGPCILVLILPTPEGWEAKLTLAGKKVTQIFNPRPGQELNRGPQDWEAEILTTAPTTPLINHLMRQQSKINHPMLQQSLQRMKYISRPFLMIGMTCWVWNHPRSISLSI